MKKILFVSSEYYPQPSPNGLCVEKIMRCCQKRGYEVVYIGATFYKQLPRHEMINGIDVYRVDHSFCNRLLHDWHKLPRWIGLLVRILVGVFCLIRKFLFLPWWPFEDFCLYLGLYKKMLELQKNCGFDAIYVTCNPIEAMAAVCRFKKKYKDVPCVYNYLDALSCGNYVQVIEERFKHTPFKGRFFKSAKRWELLFGQNANRVIVTEATKKHYETYFSDSEIFQKLKFLGLPVLERKFSGSQPEQEDISDSLFIPGRKHILFAGELYALRDPSYIIDVITSLQRDDIEFIFIGSCTLRNSNLLNSASKKYPGLFRMHPRIPRSKLEKYMVNADFFLNIEDNVPTLYASKVFEYISYGKPIISNAYSPNDPTVNVLKKYNNSLILFNTDSVQESAKRLNRFIDTYLNCKVEFERSKELFYMSTPDAFVDVIDDVFIT